MANRELEFHNLARGATEGVFRRQELPSVLVRVVRQGRTGRLTISDGPRVRTVGFSGGLPTLAGSQVQAEHFGERLVRLNLISPDDRLRVDTLMRHEPVQFGAAMVRLKLMSTAELRRMLTTHHSWIIAQALGSEQVSCSFVPFASVARDPTSLTLLQAIEDAVRAYGLEERDSLWRHAEGWRFGASDDELLLAHRLGCSRNVGALLERARGSWHSLAQLAESCEDADPQVVVLSLALAGLWKAEPLSGIDVESALESARHSRTRASAEGPAARRPGSGEVRARPGSSTSEVPRSIRASGHAEGPSRRSAAPGAPRRAPREAPPSHGRQRPPDPRAEPSWLDGEPAVASRQPPLAEGQEARQPATVVYSQAALARSGRKVAGASGAQAGAGPTSRAGLLALGVVGLLALIATYVVLERREARLDREPALLAAPPPHLSVGVAPPAPADIVPAPPPAAAPVLVPVPVPGPVSVPVGVPLPLPTPTPAPAVAPAVMAAEKRHKAAGPAAVGPGAAAAAPVATAPAVSATPAPAVPVAPASAPAAAAASVEDALRRCRAAAQGDDARQAVVDCQAVLAKDPRNALAYRLLGNAYVKLSAKAQACESLRRYLRFAPEAPDRAQVEQWMVVCQ